MFVPDQMTAISLQDKLLDFHPILQQLGFYFTYAQKMVVIAVHIGRK
jgi:hypothetical protein